MTDLKPCPFCGNNRSRIVHPDEFCGYCPRCGTIGPMSDTPELAAAAWNTRPAEDALRAELADERERVQGLANTAMEARWELEKDGDEMDAMRADIAMFVAAIVRLFQERNAMRAVVNAAVALNAGRICATADLHAAVDAYLAGREADHG